MEITKNGFIKIAASREILVGAAMAKLSTTNSSDSVNSRTFCTKNKFPAFIAEVSFGTVFSNFLYKPTFDYDYICDKYTVDIKSKHRSVYPALNFSATIPKYQVHNQNVTNYCFCSTIKEDNQYSVFLCGKISKFEFIKVATLREAGYTDTSNNMTFTEDSYELKYSDLTQWEKLPDDR